MTHSGFFHNCMLVSLPDVGNRVFKKTEKPSYPVRAYILESIKENKETSQQTKSG